MMTTPHNILIILNNRSYEYDVYTLVTAFFRGVPCLVQDPEAETADMGAQQGKIPSDAESVRTENADTLQGKIPSDAGSAKTDNAHVLQVKVLFEEDSIRISADRETAMVPRSIDDRLAEKNLLKKHLYEMLRMYAGRELPWGNLTGIRPVKIARTYLSEDPAHAKERYMEDYYVSPDKAELAMQTAEREQKLLDDLRPERGYSLYVGIPFCPSICLYCSFSSSPIGIWKDRVDDYLDALIREIRACGQNQKMTAAGQFEENRMWPLRGKELQTVYIGGGTPTTLSPLRLDRLLCAIEENFDLSCVREYTVEAGRPDSITREKLQVLKDHGITRISINPQTMNQKTLDLIGRRHTVEQTVDAFWLAREMGFDNINMDLIVGLPGEGIAEVDHTMREIEKLNPDDITVHALALKRAARLSLHMDEFDPISFQASDEIMKRCEEGCRRLGMTPYYLYRQKNMAGNFENVGYARPGKAGLYNILIMEDAQCILALGASGSTKIMYENGRIERIENVKDVKNYLERIDEMIRRKMDQM